LKNSPAHFAKSPDADSSVPTGDLAKLVRSWLLDGELSNRSPKTLKARRDITGKLQWFLARREFDDCGVEELRCFFLYLQRGHLDPGGRWGNPTETKPLRPLSLKTYFAYLRSFFSFCYNEGRIAPSPMERIPAIRDPGDEVMPFTDEEVEKLLRAAEKTRQAARDTAILLVLVDCGLRASEVCNLAYADLNLDERSLLIREGKGKKTRQAFLGKRTTRAIWKYVQLDGRDPGDPLFFSERGGALTYDGIKFIVRRIATTAGVKNAHALRARHFFALSYLKAGGDKLSLMRLMGHTTVAMTNKYVQWAATDLQAAHRQFSPADRLGANRR
jgi:site-specific recombinase XerD